jgi:effector-binding domain-containing protein
MVCLRKAISIAVAAVALGLAGVASSAAQAPTPAPAPIPSPAPAPAPAAPGAVKPADPFGEEVTLSGQTIVSMKGTATWDNAFETLVETFKTLYGYLDKQGIKPTGSAMTIYLSTDDTGFQYQAGVPIAEAPKDPPKGDITITKSPEGKALKFVHRGSYDAMDSTYEAITNFLDEKKLEAKDLFVEQYVTDPRSTAEDQLVVEVYVPLK